MRSSENRDRDTLINLLQEIARPDASEGLVSSLVHKMSSTLFARAIEALFSPSSSRKTALQILTEMSWDQKILFLDTFNDHKDLFSNDVRTRFESVYARYRYFD
jgi:hypothetical protein